MRHPLLLTLDGEWIELKEEHLGPNAISCLPIWNTTPLRFIRIPPNYDDPLSDKYKIEANKYMGTKDMIDKLTQQINTTLYSEPLPHYAVREILLLTYSELAFGYRATPPSSGRYKALYLTNKGELLDASCNIKEYYTTCAIKDPKKWMQDRALFFESEAALSYFFCHFTLNQFVNQDSSIPISLVNIVQDNKIIWGDPNCTLDDIEYVEEHTGCQFSIRLGLNEPISCIFSSNGITVEHEKVDGGIRLLSTPTIPFYNLEMAFRDILDRQEWTEEDKRLMSIYQTDLCNNFRTLVLTP